MSPNANYVAGRAFEYKRKKHWQEQGYKVARTAGSHGMFDLLCFNSERPSVYIQCKRVENSSDADRLIREFKANPPCQPSKYFKQTMEVYVKKTKEILSVTI